MHRTPRLCNFMYFLVLWFQFLYKRAKKARKNGISSKKKTDIKTQVLWRLYHAGGGNMKAQVSIVSVLIWKNSNLKREGFIGGCFNLRNMTNVKSNRQNSCEFIVEWFINKNFIFKNVLQNMWLCWSSPHSPPVGSVYSSTLMFILQSVNTL